MMDVDDYNIAQQLGIIGKYKCCQAFSDYSILSFGCQWNIFLFFLARLVNWQDNLGMKLKYVPVFMGCVVISTFAVVVSESDFFVVSSFPAVDVLTGTAFVVIACSFLVVVSWAAFVVETSALLVVSIFARLVCPAAFVVSTFAVVVCFCAVVSALAVVVSLCAVVSTLLEVVCFVIFVVSAALVVVSTLVVAIVGDCVVGKAIATFISVKTLRIHY